MKDIKVAVLAGTPVDTAMGVEYIKNKNSETEGQFFLPLCDPVSVDCDAQVRFQYSDEDEKHAVMDNIFNAEIAEGVRDFFVYCNSLAGSFDFDTYAVMKSLDSGEDIRIYTPLQVYRSLGGEYGRIGVMAANNLSAHAIEEALMAANPDIYMIGTGNMAIVRAIEDGLEPEEIIEKCGLRHMLKYMEACGAEAIVLGCTHFPYFRDELAGLTDLPVIDPADKMFEALISADC
jgi:hypothetical protein